MTVHNLTLSRVLRSLVLSLLILSLAGATAAQDSTSIQNYRYFESNIFDVRWDYQAMPGIIITDHFFQSSANTLPASLTNALLFGGLIDPALKEKAISGLSDKNIFGAELDNNIFYATYRENLPVVRSGILFGGFRNRNHIDVKLPPDMFQLIFSGNSALAGREAAINGLSLHRFRYLQYQIGFQGIKRSDDQSLSGGAAISFLQGQNHIELNMDRGHVFTHEEGEFIDLDMNFEARFSDTSDLSSTAFNGWGLGTDLNFAFEKYNHFSVAVNLQDIGFIRWNSQATHVSKDTSFTYSGFEVTDIFDFSDDLFSDTEADSLLEDLNLVETTGAYTTALQAKLNVQFTKTLPEIHTTILLGLAYRLNANYDPLVLLKAIYHFSPQTHVGLISSYGGYAKYNAGLEFGTVIGDQIYCTLGSQSLLGFLVPEQSTSSSGYVRIGVAF